MPPNNSPLCMLYYSSDMSENSLQNNVSDPTPPPIPVDLTWEALTGRNNNNEPDEKKVSWPELVGLPVKEAEKKIMDETQGVTVDIIPANYFCTADYCIDRVRLYLDGTGKVEGVPRIG